MTVAVMMTLYIEL